MHLTYRNVNAAFRGLVTAFAAGSRETFPVRRSPSRYGDVLMVDEPVIVTYERPTERVLFNAARDANPVFHLYESLWMLAGRNDVAPLAYYNSRMPEFSDDSRTFRGAYGVRWRSHFGYDQLDWAVDELAANPTSRRVVVSMWDAGRTRAYTGEAEEGSGDFHAATHGSKDVPCNLSVCLSVRNTDPTGLTTAGNVLDVTVFNRSNDLIWGMLGANVVQFSILQEYLATRLGVGVGRYHQVTNNLHVYTANWKPDEWLADETPDYYTNPNPSGLPADEQGRSWGRDFGERFPLVRDPAAFKKELPEFVDRHRNGDQLGGYYAEPFLCDVAQPACVAFHHHKRGNYPDALKVAGRIKADDWRVAAIAWIERRRAKKEAKT